MAFGKGRGQRGRTRGFGGRRGAHGIHGIHGRHGLGHGIRLGGGFHRGHRFGGGARYRAKSVGGTIAILMLAFGSFVLFGGIMYTSMGSIHSEGVSIQGVIMIGFGGMLLITGIILAFIMHKKDGGLCYNVGQFPATVIVPQGQGGVIISDPNQQQAQSVYNNQGVYHIQPYQQNQPMGQPMTQPMNQPMNQPMAYAYPQAGSYQAGYAQPMTQQPGNPQIYPPPGGYTMASAPPMYPPNNGQNMTPNTAPMNPQEGDKNNETSGMPPPPSYSQVVGHGSDGTSNTGPYQGTTSNNGTTPVI